jgi:hypothetical protein
MTKTNKNNSVNIFDEVKQGTFFKFDKVGDSVQGTYIGKMPAMGKFGPQVIYILQDKEGAVWNVSFNTTKKIVTDRMDSIRFGQIVGFKFDETRPTDKGNDAKIIRIYADPKFIDHEWLAAQKELRESAGEYTSPAAGVTSHEEEEEEDDGAIQDPNMFNGKPFVVPADAAPTGTSIPVETSAPKNDALDAIRQLAITKELVSPTMAQVTIDKTISEFAGLPMIEENFTKIIIAITGYKG